MTTTFVWLDLSGNVFTSRASMPSAKGSPEQAATCGNGAAVRQRTAYSRWQA